MTTVVSERILLYRMVVLRAALKLEVAGMRKRGRSAAATVRKEFGLRAKGRAQLLREFDELIARKRKV